jgi:hypothetical protein
LRNLVTDTLALPPAFGVVLWFCDIGLPLVENLGKITPFFYQIFPSGQRTSLSIGGFAPEAGRFNLNLPKNTYKRYEEEICQNQSTGCPNSRDSILAMAGDWISVCMNRKTGNGGNLPDGPPRTGEQNRLYYR